MAPSASPRLRGDWRPRLMAHTQSRRPTLTSTPPDRRRNVLQHESIHRASMTTIRESERRPRHAGEATELRQRRFPPSGDNGGCAERQPPARAAAPGCERHSRLCDRVQGGSNSNSSSSSLSQHAVLASFPPSRKAALCNSLNIHCKNKNTVNIMWRKELQRR